jgi:hypothetical protein
MPAFTEEFERNFKDARRRVSPQANEERLNGKQAKTAGVSLNDFQAYMPMHAYIFEPTGELWPASSVNSRFPQSNEIRAVREDSRRAGDHHLSEPTRSTGLSHEEAASRFRGSTGGLTS